MTRAELREAGAGPRSERFVDTETGEQVSRRQAQNVVLRSLGWRSRAEYERVMTDNRSRVIAAKVVDDARYGGRRPPLGRLIGPQTPLAQGLRDARREGWSRDPRGAWARALRVAGMRDPGDRQRVGFSRGSPRRRRRNQPIR